jgi:hypothetical protein
MLSFWLRALKSVHKLFCFPQYCILCSSIQFLYSSFPVKIPSDLLSYNNLLNIFQIYLINYNAGLHKDELRDFTHRRIVSPGGNKSVFIWMIIITKITIFDFIDVATFFLTWVQIFYPLLRMWLLCLSIQSARVCKAHGDLGT